MRFWWFMLAQCALIPVIMILSGHLMRKHHTKSPNSLLGYRTSRSTKNEQTWAFANRYCGRLYVRVGLAALVPSALLLLPFRGGENDLVGGVGTAMTLVQCALLLLPIFPTERALKRAFDDEGRPR